MNTPRTPDNNIRRLPRPEERTERTERTAPSPDPSTDLPGDESAEQNVLGCILEDAPRVLPLVRSILQPDDFTRAKHSTIYQVILDMADHGDPVDVSTVPIELHRLGKLADVEDIGYVSSLVNRIVSTHSAEYFARTVKDASVARQAIDWARQVVQIGYDNIGGAAIIAKVEELTTQMRERAGTLGARRFGILSDLELEEMRPSRGILGSWVRDKDIAAIYGATDSYKSFLAISMGECWATGVDWFGMPVEQRTVLYIAAEAPGTIGDRVAAWKKHHGLEGRQTAFYTSTLPVDLSNAEEVLALIGEIRDCLPDAPGAVIIDTYACATSGDEKDAASVNAAYRGMRLLRDAFDATIVYVDHEGKDRERGQTGSQRKKDNVDVQIHVERIEGSEGMITVTPRKTKAGEHPGPLTLQTRQISFYNTKTQELRNSLVLINTSKAVARAASNEARAERLSRRQRQALDVLTDQPDGSATYGDWWRACHKGNPKTFPKSTFDDCRDTLVRLRLVSVNDTVYASLVRNENRTSTPAPHRTSTVGTVPYIGDRTTIPNRTSLGDGVPAVPDVLSEDTVEHGQTAPYHRHNPRTMKVQKDGITICDECHPRPGA